MPSVSSTVTIGQPVEKVFAYVVDVANHKAWQAGILDAKVSPDGPLGVGSTYQYTSEVMGHRLQTAMQISAFVPNQKWAVKTTGVPTPQLMPHARRRFRRRPPGWRRFSSPR